MVKKKVIFDQTKTASSPAVPQTVDTASDDYILDSLSLLPDKENLKNIPVPKDQQSDNTVTYQTAPLPDKQVQKAQQEAQAEAKKESIKKAARAEQVMQDIIGNAPRVLFHCTATFPFDFFPDEISIEETRVNLIQRQFWSSAEIKAVGIEDITEVVVSTSILFATLKIGSRTFIDNMVEIRFLHKKDAMKARRIIEGLRVLNGQKVDMSALELSLLVAKVEEIGAIQKPV